MFVMIVSHAVVSIDWPRHHAYLRIETVVILLMIVNYLLFCLHYLLFQLILLAISHIVDSNLPTPQLIFPQ